MNEEMAQLEERLQKALEQQKESMVNEIIMCHTHLWGTRKHLNNGFKGFWITF